jgi:superfamily II DNA or RNA helicase
MEGICESSVQDSTAMVKSRFRYYQQEADDAIYSNEDKRCVVVMFCGTGKSLVMRYCKIVQDKQLVVYVFPSLSLIEQFHSSYLMDFDQDNLLKVSSDEESESTTDFEDIMSFLCKSDNKIVCVTYQSYETLTCCLGDNRIDVCIYDEAHHVVGEKYQQAILDTDYCDKQVFFTATPRNANGIVMMDTNQPDIGVCGEVVYKYNYFRGVMEGYLNAFDVRIDFYSEHTNNSVYE